MYIIMDIKECIERARNVHGNKYDYSNFMIVAR